MKKNNKKIWKFSLVIPVAPYRNAEILKSINNLNFNKKEFEIIIKKGTNPSNNRNSGARKAKGKFIGFLDDDAVLDKEILKKAEDFFKNNKQIDIVGGPQLTPEDDKGFAKISGYALASKFGGWKMANRYSRKKLNLNADETMLTSANLFCRRDVMKKIKFDTSLWPGEDPKFIEDAKKAGFKVAYSPEIVVYHRRRPDAKGFMKQIFSYGKTRTQKESISSTLKRPFFLIPSIFVIYLSILLFMIISNTVITENVIGNKIPDGNFSFLIWIPLILYLILNVSFSLADAITNRHFTSFFILPFVYLMIHLSYGVGMIYGYLKRKNNKKLEK